MEILKELRERSGLTLRQVQEATLISNAYLSQLETGKIKKPSAQVLYTLSKLYNTDMETLLIESGLLKQTDVQPIILQPSIKKRIEELEKRMSEVEIFHKVFNQNP